MLGYFVYMTLCSLIADSKDKSKEYYYCPCQKKKECPRPLKRMYTEVTGYCMYKFFWKQIFSSKIIVKSKKSIWLHWNILKPSLCNFNNIPSSQHTGIKHSRFTAGLDKLNYSLLPQEAPKEVEKHIFLNVAMKTTGSTEQ